MESAKYAVKAMNVAGINWIGLKHKFGFVRFILILAHGTAKLNLGRTRVPFKGFAYKGCVNWPDAAGGF